MKAEWDGLPLKIRPLPQRVVCHGRMIAHVLPEAGDVARFPAQDPAMKDFWMVCEDRMEKLVREKQHVGCGDDAVGPLEQVNGERGEHLMHMGRRQVA